MPIFKGQGHAYLRHRSDSCLEWHCLSSATHFGIIFSIVVVFIILSIVWMYYMGRASIFRKQSDAHNVHRRQRNRHHHRNLKGPARPVSHVVQQIPVLQYGVAQKAPIYLFSGPQVLPAQPLSVMNSHVPLPAAALRPPEAHQPKVADDIAFEPPKAQGHHQEKAQHSHEESSTHHPTWWQRFYRAFNLPVGAASTVASSPSPEPAEPSKAANIGIRQSASYPSFEDRAVQVDSQKEARDLERPVKEQDEISSIVCNLNSSSDSMQSIRSDVATVHSDDYEVVSR
ncbi:hypothetical protein TrVFT333_008477 [Trichoderma virens FT-333]|nr:hypothetical protein TrVFT333_008477 [Trichoderma virens FT-333]